MIIKHRDVRPEPSDPRLRAGAAAESQMAFYLQRAFGNDPEILVVHDLRVVDPAQPNPDGSPGTAQIDHLILHRWGAIIVESKSVTDAVEVRDDGAGGDEWCRVYGRKKQGFPSPLGQGHRQGAFLRELLRPHNEELKRKKTLGFIQGGFVNMPVQVVVAISDSGRIERRGKWQPRSKPFADHVAKADQVADWIAAEIARHRKAAGLFTPEDGEYGLWRLDPADLKRVTEFLLSRHAPLVPPAAPTAGPIPVGPPPVPREPAPAVQTPALHKAPPAPASPSAASGFKPGAACKHCGGSDLEGKWGRYGYYWACRACGKNTPMPTVCGACGAEGRGGRGVKIRKDGPKFERVCECGAVELVWSAS